MPDLGGIPLTCVPEDVPVEEQELPDQAETSPSRNEPLLSPVKTSAKTLDLPVVETMSVVRRPSQQHQPPIRSQYAALLVSVLQMLFHGLVDT